MRKNKLECSTTESLPQHLELAAAIRECQTAVHAALLDNIDTAAAMQLLLGALRAQPPHRGSRDLLHCHAPMVLPSVVHTWCTEAGTVAAGAGR